MKSLPHLITILLILATAVAPSAAWSALEADEILLITNHQVKESRAIARYYQRVRGVPAGNLLELDLPSEESCSREAYNRKAAAPVRRWLRRQQKEIKEIRLSRAKNSGADSPPAARRPVRCLLTIYGVPLKVLPTVTSPIEKADARQAGEELKEIRERLKDLMPDDPDRRLLLEKERSLKEKIELTSHASELAALDSELALVMADFYTLTHWVPNPSYLGYRRQKIKNQPGLAYMVARLDGPDPDLVRRLIDDSLAAEKKGLRGRAYFDARWPQPAAEKTKSLSGYAFYDNSLYLAAEQVSQQTSLPVTINQQSELFQPGECPEAALYCGWYRLSHYLDAFNWQPGAVAYHIASGECTSLKKGDGWCLGMLRDGAAAVIGPVAEPYVQAFPPPALFFALLTDGRYTLAECFALSAPMRSWRMVLVGDPLYRPFVK